MMSVAVYEATWWESPSLIGRWSTEPIGLFANSSLRVSASVGGLVEQACSVGHPVAAGPRPAPYSPNTPSVGRMSGQGIWPT